MRASELNDAGKQAYREKDYVKAFEYYKKAAVSGNVEALNNLGDCYEKGKGTKQDCFMAKECYEGALERGSTIALINLGDLYEDGGEGFPIDYNKAFDFFSKAAEKNKASALFRLGLLYVAGKGCSKDIGKAIECYKKIADKGYGLAARNLAIIYEEDRGEFEKAFEYYKKAAEAKQAKSKNAEYSLGRCYYKGIGCIQDKQKGLDLIRKSASEGNENAKKFLSANGYKHVDKQSSDTNSSLFDDGQSE